MWLSELLTSNRPALCFPSVHSLMDYWPPAARMICEGDVMPLLLVCSVAWSPTRTSRQQTLIPNSTHLLVFELLRASCWDCPYIFTPKLSSKSANFMPTQTTQVNICRVCVCVDLFVIWLNTLNGCKDSYCQHLVPCFDDCTFCSCCNVHCG